MRDPNASNINVTYVTCLETIGISIDNNYGTIQVSHGTPRKDQISNPIFLDKQNSYVLKV